MNKQTAAALNDVYAFARNNACTDLYRELPESKGSFAEHWRHVPLLTRERLRASTLQHYAEKEVRYLVSQFDPAPVEDMFLMPQRTDFRWETLDAEIQAREPFVAVLIVPLFWQMGPMFYHTCRKRGVPVSVLSPRNLPLAVQLIKEVKADMVVATPQAAGELQALLDEAGLAQGIRVWHLIAPFGSDVSVPKLSGETTIEYHLFPGVPVAYAPDTRSREFLPLPDYYFEHIDGECVISSLVPHACPLIRFKTGVKMDTDGNLRV